MLLPSFHGERSAFPCVSTAFALPLPLCCCRLSPANAVPFRVSSLPSRRRILHMPCASTALAAKTLPVRVYSLSSRLRRRLSLWSSGAAWDGLGDENAMESQFALDFPDIQAGTTEVVNFLGMGVCEVRHLPSLPCIPPAMAPAR